MFLFIQFMFYDRIVLRIYIQGGLTLFKRFYIHGISYNVPDFDTVARASIYGPKRISLMQAKSY